MPFAREWQRALDRETSQKPFSLAFQGEVNRIVVERGLRPGGGPLLTPIEVTAMFAAHAAGQTPEQFVDTLEPRSHVA